MSAHLTERTTKAFRLSFIGALLTLLALSAAPPAMAWEAPKAWSTAGNPSTARYVHTRMLLPAHAPGIWIKTGGVNEITPALTEGTVTPHDDEASEFVHQIQQWGTFGSQSFATAQEALDWVHGNIAYGEDQANYGVPEAWANPEQTLSQRSGDCEDQAFLLASLLKWHTAEVNTGGGDLVLANCGFVLPPDGAFHCWVIWYDASNADWHQLDPTSGLMNGILYPALGTLWLDDAHVFGFLHEYYPGPLPVVGGYDREDFARIAAGGFGDPMNNYPWSMAHFHGDLYVGTGRNVPWLVEWVLRTTGMVPAWLELFIGITRPREPVGSREWAEDVRGEIWRYRDGSWEHVYRSGIVTHPLTGWWVPEEIGFRRMIVFTDAAGEQAIYAANGSVLPQVCTNSLLMKSTDGATWQRVVTPPAMGCDSRAMTIHNGKLYVATGLGERAQVWATDRPSTVADNWDLVADFTDHDPTNSNVTSLASFNGYLYAGTQNFVTGFQAFRSNARSPAGPVLGGWTRIISHGAGDMMNYWAGTMTVFKNHLYLGTMSWPIKVLSGELAVPKGFELLRIRSNDSWELLIGEYIPRMPPPGGAELRLPASGWPGGFGNFLNLYCWSLVEDGGVLYLGTFDATTFLRVLPAPDFAALVDLTDEQLGHMVFALEQIIGLLEAHGVSEAYLEPYRRLLEALDVGDPDLVDWDEVQQILYDGFAGGDLWKSEDGDYWEPVTLTGFGNSNNYGVRNLVRTNPLFVGMANPFQGAEIWRAPPTVVTIVKETDPDGGTGFQFAGDLGDFTLDDNGSRAFADLVPGDYDVSEIMPGADWEIERIVCTGADTTPISGGVTIHLNLGQTVTCTFNNHRRSLKVTKELELPVGGLAAVDQIVRFLITIENDGEVTVDPIALRDEYDGWCLRSRRAEFPPDVHGGMAGFLQWNDLGALAPGETLSLWVEFTANHACEEATNTATVQTAGLTFEGQATLRILETIARVGGYIFHDDNGDGALNLPCRGTDVTPATCEPGLEGATASTTWLSGTPLHYVTNTSGWYSFNVLDPETYHVEASAPGSGWWTPTTAEMCDATVVDNWDWVFCHFGYWWGLDGPPVQAASVAANEMTLSPTQDATISEWAAGNQGMDEHLRVRQPGVTSALLQFDLTGLPYGAEIVWAKLRLYSPFASNGTNRLYMTAYPLDKGWVEEEVTWLQTANGSPWDEPGATGDHGDPVGWAWIDAPGWVEFDLDPAGLLASDYGFLVRGEGTDNREVAYWLFSREYVNAAIQPQLLVGYNVP